MIWTSHRDESLIGSGAADILSEAEMRALMGDLACGYAHRFRNAAGNAVWCRLTPGGALQCVCVAPWGEGWDEDRVSERAFFAKPWPSHWQTKSRVTAAKGDKKPKPDNPFKIDGFACSVGHKGRRATLWQVASVADDGSLESVRPMLDAPAFTVAETGEKAFWPLDPKHDEGARLLLAERPVSAAAYPFICSACSNAVMHPMTRARMKRDAARKGQASV